MTKRFATARIAASQVRAGHVLYHGGEVVSVSRDGGMVIITTKGGAWMEPASRRLTYYPNM